MTDATTLLQNLNERLQAIYKSLPSRSALIIFTGHDDPRAMAELNRRRVEFEAGFKAIQGNGNGNSGFGSVGGYLGGGVLLGKGGVEDNSKVRDPETGEEVRWTGVDARKLEEEVEKAKRGLMFLCIKK
jgi:RNA exonuclease 1